MEIWKLLFILVTICVLGAYGIGGSWRDRIRGTPFGLRQSHLRHVTYEGFGGGFGVGFNGGFGNIIEQNFGSIGVDDKKRVSESFVSNKNPDWSGPNNYKGPNQGMWHGWDSEASDMGGNWGWYGWSYPWAWYGPVEFAVDCYSDADCGEKSFCGSNGYCMKRDDV